MTVETQPAAPAKTDGGPDASNPASAAQRERQAWMSILAKAESKDLADRIGRLQNLPAYSVIRPAECGSVMVRGRAGGMGAAFNLGEMSVTRCVIQLTGTAEAAVIGHAYVAGRDKQHAESAALMDALLQTEQWHAAVKEMVITPLANVAADARRERSGKVAATKVNFFTMVRGEN
ncbi:phosphonate C-P lyase system protein PhnG [Hwanghaeella grinnelliae]|uniref:Phosphonate C-P lyase system protein PhnG n=1 Tax=Hwanghaeella grinnelliae TaxID=2500179 RepID=A0A3S2VP31_9PROT|nr:phosphonate C-P lyase system protein PhnG [Hwanghaeella grinnelliae]RVU35155.1 phosphonate C-P lyase system protein PhnG [Hwanghaeella grinnelliae]